jgi:hypothetical protein
MATPPPIRFDTVTIALVTAGITPTALAAAIATLQVVANASYERAMGVVVGTTASATAAACPHPPAGPPFIVVGVSAPADPVVGAIGTLAVAAAISTLVVIAAGAVHGHPPAGLPFLATGMSAPTGAVTDATGP